MEVHLVYRHSTLNLIRNKIITKIEHNKIENPQLAGSNQLDNNKRGQGIDVGKTKNKFSKSEQDMDWGQLYCKSNMLATGQK